MKAILAAALIALPVAATAGDARDLAGEYSYSVEDYTGRMTVSRGVDGYTVRAATAAPGGFTCGLELAGVALGDGVARVRHPDVPADMACTVRCWATADCRSRPMGVIHTCAERTAGWTAPM
jgi:hypothetical protein